MGRINKLLRDLGDNMSESVGARAPVDPVHHEPESPTVSGSRSGGPYDGFMRLEGAGLVPIGHVTPDPNNPRTEWDEEDLARLADSIRQRGLIQPIRTRWDETLGKHVVTVGERRYRAALLAGLTHVPCICTTTSPTEAEILVEGLQENLLRSDLGPLDQARAYQRYLDLTGETAAKLAEILCVHPSTVSRALALTQLPAEVQAAVSTGEISPTAGAEIARIKNPEVAKKVARKAAETKAPVTEVEKQVRQKRGVPAKATPTQPFIQYKISRGTRVVIHGRLDGRQVLAALEAAVEMARADLEQAEQEQEQEELVDDES
jgi:ParB family transcriptional regulator, chromosome partitioning protein